MWENMNESREKIVKEEASWLKKKHTHTHKEPWEERSSERMGKATRVCLRPCLTWYLVGSVVVCYHC